MATADLVIIGVMVLSGVLALMRGFTREVFSVISWGGSAFVTLWLFPPLRSTGRALLSAIDTPWIADVVTAGVIFILTLVALTYVTTKATEKLRGANPGPFDGTAGFIFGLARGFVLVALVYHFYGLVGQPTPGKDPEWMAKSAFLPLIKQTNQAFSALVDKAEQKIPQNTANGPQPSNNQYSRNERAGQPSRDEVQADRTSGYSSDSRSDLDRLLSANAASRNPGSNRP